MAAMIRLFAAIFGAAMLLSCLGERTWDATDRHRGADQTGNVVIEYAHAERSDDILLAHPVLDTLCVAG